MKYSALVQQITNLPWAKYDPKAIIYLSSCSAIEFAESLRCGLIAYPQNQELQEMANGELMTNNLRFEDYSRYGDHWAFLEHFCSKYRITRETLGMYTFGQKLLVASSNYFTGVRALGGNEVRAMTVFSREQELPGIFKTILMAHDWDKEELSFFKYYLERHIELDSNEGGHGDLTKNFEMDENIIFNFYTLRLEMYKSLEK